MSTNEEMLSLKQEVAYLEASLASVRENNGIWDRIFKESYWGIMICDAITSEFLNMNSCYAEMHGYSTEELIGKSIYDVFAPECHKDIPGIVQRVYEQGHYAYKTVHIRKNGSRFPVHTDSYEVTINARRLRYVSLWDITENERKEEELAQYRQSLEDLVKFRTKELERINEQLRSEIRQKNVAKHLLAKANREITSTLETMSDSFFTVNRQWIVTYVNKTMVKALKANGRSDLVGTDFQETYNEDSQKIKEACFKAMNEGLSSQFETFASLVGHWVECNIVPTESGIATFFRNIEERKRNEKAVEEEHHRLYSIFNGFPGLIIVQEENYKIRYANSRFQAKFGPGEGRFCYDVLAESTVPCQHCVNLRIMEDSTSLWKEVLLNNRLYEVYVHPFTDVDGSKLILKVFIDITDRKEADRELARLDRLNMVGEMAAGIAHEVRNPLTTVRGFLQLLGSKGDTEHYRDYYELMIQELDRANQIISDFLNLAREKSANFTRTNITNIVRSLVPLLSADALNQDKEFNLELEQIPDFQGNENELRQLILNLARNGFEAMEGGKTLTIQTLKDEDSLILRVCDEGGGVNPVIFEKLGTPFLTTKEQGTGLGLTICKSIAARHNAVLSFESSPTGTTVTVRFAC